MARKLIAVAVVAVAAWMADGVAQGVAGPGESLQARIDAAAPGDTLVIEGGAYQERIVIDKSIAVIGRNSPVIDGEGEGDIVTITAPDVTFSGFTLRNSGRVMSRDPAAIKVDEVDRVTLRRNRIENARFGIYVLGSDSSSIVNNVMDLGADVEMAHRGYGIYLWRTTNSAVHGNTVENASDGIHLEFSDHNGIGSNEVTESRYAVHFMYSHENRILANTFTDNLSGAVLMFSRDILLKDNEFSSNRRGATGAGILLKDCDNVFAEDNRLLRNKYGMTVEGTPQAVGATAVFRRNLFALNDTGIAVMSNSPITFVENAMIDNTVQVRALGRDLASRLLSSHSSAGGDDSHAAHVAAGEVDAASLPDGVAWTTADGRGNYWSDYTGYDADGDGVGDRAYEPQPAFAGRLAQDDALRLFHHTLAQQAIDTAAELFPVYRYEPVMVDQGPLMEPPAELALPESGGLNRQLLYVSGGLLAVAGWVVWVTLAPETTVPRRVRRPRVPAH